MGWRKASQLPSIFADVVPELSLGELSDLIRSPAGFHIIKLAELSSGGGGVVVQTRARHILVATDELTTAEDAQSRLWQAKERLANGEDFADLAQSMSQDRASAIKGGDLGWTTPGQFVPAFEAVIVTLRPGEVSDPFESQFGWHIILVEDRREQDNSDEVRRAMAYEELSKRKADEEAQAWLRQIRDEAYVEYRLDE
jgi:peptidyl-prolyl cis-trans isomerase SurA